jgi:hypothetical protein
MDRYELDPHEVVLLDSAARTADLIAELQAVIDSEGSMLDGKLLLLLQRPASGASPSVGCSPGCESLPSRNARGRSAAAAREVSMARGPSDAAEAAAGATRDAGSPAGVRARRLGRRCRLLGCRGSRSARAVARRTHRVGGRPWTHPLDVIRQGLNDRRCAAGVHPIVYD